MNEGGLGTFHGIRGGFRGVPEGLRSVSGCFKSTWTTQGLMDLGAHGRLSEFEAVSRKLLFFITIVVLLIIDLQSRFQGRSRDFRRG